MLIEQSIEFELRWPGSPGRTWTPKINYFLYKTKTTKASLQVNNRLLLKILQEAMYLAFPPPGPSHLQNLTPKCQIFNVFWTRPVIKGRTEQLVFFNWLLNLKI